MNDLTGQKFGKWTVLKFSRRNKSHYLWICQCSCGNIKEVDGVCLRNGKSTKCYDCSHLFHGLRRHPLYKIWADIKQRCFNQKRSAYKNYGGRGISICNEWKNSPEVFIEWCLNNKWQKGLEIDRINNNGNYEPDNCRFVTITENAQNKRCTKLNFEKIKDIRHALIKGVSYSQLAKLYHVDKSIIGDIKHNKIWRNVA